MSEKYIRIYKKHDIYDIKKHLLIYGDLSGNCSNCNEIDVKLDSVKCPKCGNEFKYISFRNVRQHLPKLHKLAAERPNVILVDYDDFKRNYDSLKAGELFK